MYLPSLPDDPIDALANAVSFDEIVQVRLEQLLLATRYASLSLVGWRIFGSLVRTIMVRTGESEVKNEVKGINIYTRSRSVRSAESHPSI